MARKDDKALFVEKFGDFISELSKLEKDKEIREKCYDDYCKTRGLGDGFYKLLKSVINTELEDDYSNVDYYGLELFYAIENSIHYFSSGDANHFINYVRKAFIRNIAESDMNSGDHKYYINRAVKAIREAKAIEKSVSGTTSVIDKHFIEVFFGEDKTFKGHRFSKLDRELVYFIIINGSTMFLDEPIENDNDENLSRHEITELKDTDDLSSGYNKSAEFWFLKNMEQEEAKKKTVELINQIASSDFLSSVFNKEERDYYKLFMTRTILIAMKLEYYSKERIKEYKEILKDYDDGDNKWNEFVNSLENNLPKVSFRNKTDNEDTIATNSKKKYLRGGDPGFYRYIEKPAGNADIFDFFQSHECNLYATVFHKDYLNTAIDGDYSKLEYVFKNFLKKDFNFSNKIIAEVKGCGEPAISKRYKGMYIGKTLPVLWEKYKEISNNN
ncbi:MAG: hypothetical protein E7271_08505 [Lachnospiraceae bacterium]|jgi:hypothetical protein|nr:hypothetical protein [Lachnospiraceae bacterium]